MSKSMLSTLAFCRVSLCIALLLGFGGGALQAAEIEGTVIDRNGVRHTVRKLEIRGSTTLEYYVGGKRRQMSMSRIDRVHLAGSLQDQQVPVVVTMRSGRVETGTFIIDGGSSLSDNVVAGGGHDSDRLTGSTDLGPLWLPLTNVQEILFVHDEDASIVPDAVNGSIVDERGRRIAVRDIRYRGDEAFRFLQGRKKRRVALRHVTQLLFGDSPGGEIRPVTITYRTGKVVQGTVDAGAVRLSGEVDYSYRARVDSAFTGVLSSGDTYGIGLHSVTLVLVDREPEKTGAGSDETEDDATDR